MKKILFLRCRCWSVLQMFTVVVCYLNSVSGEIAQGCVGSRLNLACSDMKIIRILDVVLGDSDCHGKSCCIKDDDCTRNASTIHTSNVRSRCDNKQSCIIDVHKEGTRCGFWGKWSNNDFERITYICIHVDDPPNFNTPETHAEDTSLDRTTQPSIETTQSSINETTTDDARNKASEEGDQPKGNNTVVSPAEAERNSLLLPVAMLIIISIILIVIILVLIKLRRFMRSARKISVSLSFKDNEESESQETDLNDYTSSPTPVSSFRSRTSTAITVSQGRKARNCESASYEMPIAVVSHKVTKECAGSRLKDDVQCDMEPAHVLSKMRARANSFVLDFEKSYCNEISTMLDNEIYRNVEIGRLKRSASSQRHNYEEVLDQSEYSNVETTMTAKKPELEVYIPLNMALEIAAISALKNDFDEQVGEQSEVINSEGFHGSAYDTISPEIPEMNRVKEPTPLSILSIATREHSAMEKDSERENPYCEMQWSQPRFEQDSEFEDSTNDSSINNKICYNVESREPAKTESSKGNDFKEDCKRRESNGVTSQHEKANPTQKTGLDACNTFNRAAPLTSMSEDELDIDYDLGSPEIWFTTDEGQNLIENDIYNH